MKKTTQQIVNQKIADLKKEELITPNPCQSGYIAIGMKIKNGVKVPTYSVLTKEKNPWLQGCSHHKMN